ncbi:MAG: DUF4394 domain-containing protein [Phycisphaerales bacterium]
MKNITYFTAILGVCGAALSARAELVYGVTQQQTLVSWDSAAPGALLTGMAISGLQLNETILGIDLRPATGQIYALGSFNRLYTLNPSNGQATQVGGTFSTALNGSNFGFDFNPMIDRIRVVSNTNNNYVLNPNTGDVQAVATNVFFAAGDVNQGADPNIVHSAYSNNFVGTTSTQLFGLDTGLDVLVRQANSAGTLNTVGSVNTDLTELGGFDISGATGVAYAVVRDNAQIRSTFWTINLTTGAGSMVGQIGGGEIITAMTVVPSPGVLGLASACIMVGARRRRS